MDVRLPVLVDPRVVRVIWRKTAHVGVGGKPHERVGVVVYARKEGNSLLGGVGVEMGVPREISTHHRLARHPLESYNINKVF